jgi:regulator of replication initiation timing
VQKELEFAAKESRTKLGHLQLENQRLSERLSSAQERAANELTLAQEEQEEREQGNLKNL